MELIHNNLSNLYDQKNKDISTINYPIIDYNRYYDEINRSKIKNLEVFHPIYGNSYILNEKLLSHPNNKWILQENDKISQDYSIRRRIIIIPFYSYWD